MTQQVYIVDSFTDRAFAGNPAGVLLSGQPLDETRMQQIASELNLSETAFVTPNSDLFLIRYFSPKMEIPLCGHATLAASKVLFDQTAVHQLRFQTRERLQLDVRQVNGQMEMVFPVYALRPAVAPQALLAALGISHLNFVGFNEETKILLLEIESAAELAALKPDYAALLKSHNSLHGVSVTAQADDEFDFHSRFFWPWSGGDEDPVTGGTHTFLANYWAERLGKSVLRSFQASSRTGQMEVEITSDNQLLIRGHAVPILAGEMRS